MEGKQLQRRRRYAALDRARLRAHSQTQSGRRQGMAGMTDAGKQRDLLTGGWRSIIKPQKETAMHIELVALLRAIMKPTVIWRHVPNGEHRDIRTAAKLKAMGVLPGSADLEFHWVEVDVLERKRRRCLHLELKVGNRPASDVQIAFGLAVQTMLGDEYAIARSVNEAIAI